MEAFNMKTTMKRSDRIGVGSVAAFAIAGAVACSSSSGPSYPSSTTTMDGGAEAQAATGGGSDVTLTVMNFMSWCSVTVNAGPSSSSSSVTASVAAGSTAMIVATPASSSFQIGADPWFGVTQDDGGAAPGMDNGTGTSETTTATVVVVTGNRCVSVCCQLPGNGPPPCPTTNPCL
jgi:hypothetical protein